MAAQRDVPQSVSHKIIRDERDPPNKILVHRLLGHGHRVTYVAFSPDGKTLASASWDNTIKLWDVSMHTPEGMGTLTGHSAWVQSVAFSPHGKTLASGSSDYTIKLWNVATKECKATLEGHSHYVRSVAFSPDGKTLASGSGDSTIKLWAVSGDTANLKSTVNGQSGGTQLQPWPVDCVNCVAFSPDGSTLASCGEDTHIRLWNVSGDTLGLKQILHGHSQDSPGCNCFSEGDYTYNRACPVKGHSGAVTSVAFSPDGKTLAASGSNEIKLWNLSEGEFKFKEALHVGLEQVMSVAFSSDKKTLASGDANGIVMLWDVSGDTTDRKYTLVADPHAATSVAFSPDGKTLATGCLNLESVKLWNRIPHNQYHNIDLRLNNEKKLAFLMITHAKNINMPFNDLPEDALIQMFGIEYLYW